MELDGARVQLGEVEALDGAVVQRDVRRLAVLGRCDREAVVLARHQYAAGRPLAGWVVRAAVPEGELERLVVRREREQLVAEADAEHARAAEELPQGRDLV